MLLPHWDELSNAGFLGIRSDHSTDLLFLFLLLLVLALSFRAVCYAATGS